MRLLSTLVMSMHASTDWWDQITGPFVFETLSPVWDTSNEDLGDIVSESEPVPNLTGPIQTPANKPTQSHDVLWVIPKKCMQRIKMIAREEFASGLRRILETGAMPSITQMVNSRGVVKTTDPRYKSLHNSVRMFRNGLELSEFALRELLTFRSRKQLRSPEELLERYSAKIRPNDPLKSAKCDVVVWYSLVVHFVGGRKVSDLEVERYVSPRGYPVYRPIGGALQRIVGFELQRVKA
jgi:hypothetical protein